LQSNNSFQISEKESKTRLLRVELEDKSVFKTIDTGLLGKLDKPLWLDV